MAKASKTNAAPSAALIATLGVIGAGAYLTQAQGADAVTAGLATVDTSNTGQTASGEPGAFVTLTDAGKAAIANPAAPVAPAAKPVFTIRSDIAMPTKSKRGRHGSVYPIDKLEVNQSFHVAPTDANDDPVSRMASTIANARLKYATPVFEADGTTPVMVEKTKRTYKSENGKLLKDAEGHRIVDTETTESVQKTDLGRDFMVTSVDESDPEGVGARVWRTK